MNKLSNISRKRRIKQLAIELLELIIDYRLFDSYSKRIYKSVLKGIIKEVEDGEED